MGISLLVLFLVWTQRSLCMPGDAVFGSQLSVPNFWSPIFGSQFRFQIPGSRCVGSHFSVPSFWSPAFGSQFSVHSFRFPFPVPNFWFLVFSSRSRFLMFLFTVFGSIFRSVMIKAIFNCSSGVCVCLETKAANSCESLGASRLGEEYFQIGS